MAMFTLFYLNNLFLDNIEILSLCDVQNIYNCILDISIFFQKAEHLQKYFHKHSIQASQDTQLLINLDHIISNIKINVEKFFSVCSCPNKIKPIPVCKSAKIVKHINSNLSFFKQKAPLLGSFLSTLTSTKKSSC